MLFRTKFLLSAVFLSSIFSNINSCRGGNCCACTGSNPSSREHSYNDYEAAQNSPVYIGGAHVMDYSFTQEQLKKLALKCEEIKKAREKEEQESKSQILLLIKQLSLERRRELMAELGSGSASNSSEISPTGSPKNERESTMVSQK